LWPHRHSSPEATKENKSGHKGTKSTDGTKDGKSVYVPFVHFVPFVADLFVAEFRDARLVAAGSHSTACRLG